MKESVLDLSIRQLALRELGAIGGKSKSPKKLAAMRKNLKKAWAARRKLPAGK